MKKFIGAGFLILIVTAVGVFLNQKNSDKAAPISFLEDTKPAAPTSPIVVDSTSTENLKTPAVEKTSLKEGEFNLFVLDRSANPNSRRQVLQQLVQAGPAKLAEMAAIAKAPVPHFPQAKNPHSSDAGYYKFEKGLRITAIETLDQWAVQGTDVLKELTQIRDNQNEQDLVFLAGLAVTGIQEGRPGKVTRFIDQAFDEALNGK